MTIYWTCLGRATEPPCPAHGTTTETRDGRGGDAAAHTKASGHGTVTGLHADVLARVAGRLEART